MLKDNKKVIQVNSETLPTIFKKKYPKSTEIFNYMVKNGWELNTYSEYDNKLNLYFD